jgi:hypothetical protein
MPRLADIAMKQLAVKIPGSGNVEAPPKDNADTGSGRTTQAPIEAAEGNK